jgi:hypothetical protein
MKVKITVMADVDWCDKERRDLETGDPLEARICDSVAAAVRDALRRQEDNGFHHDLQGVIRILTDYATVEILK